MSLETERLLLRRWRAEDLDAYVELMSDSRVTEFLGAPRTRVALRESAERIARRLEDNGYGWWVLEVKGRASFAGVILLQDIPFEAHFTPAVEVGWHLMAEHWGKGYATEGGRAAIDFGFTHLDLPEIVAITAAGNHRSQRVMQRLGMTYDRNGDFDNPFVPEGSPLRRHVLYRIARER